MLRILRAFAWMRWRVVVNSLEWSGARDTVERLSVAFEQLVPIIGLLLLGPSAVALGALSGYAGFDLARTSQQSTAFEIVRYLMLGALVLSIVGALILPAGERTNAVRFLLLPIPRRVLYVAQLASTLIDPWILLTIPVVLALPIGLVAGGQSGAAGVALAAGLLFLFVLIGLASLATTVLHLLMRDRRRGELLALLFILVVPAALMLPSAFHGSGRGGTADAQQRRPARDPMPAWVRQAGPRIFALLPSEQVRTSIQAARRRDAPAASRAAGSLLLAAGVIHALSLVAFVRTLDSPASSRGRRESVAPSARVVTLPGVSAGASAIAVSQIRLALRTPRGRSVLISPFVVFMMFGILMVRGGGSMEFGFISLHGGLALAIFGAVVCLLSLLPLAMNQFAIDRAGLTLQLLSPLSDRDILIGKAIGNGAIAGIPAVICIAIAYALFPVGSPALWLSLPLGVVATYTLAVPAAAAISAVFPRAVNLNSIGQASNAHGLAGLLGMAAFAAAAAPAVFLAVAAVVLDRPGLAFWLLLGWCALALLISRWLLAPVASLLQRRRENLGLVVN